MYLLRREIIRAQTFIPFCVKFMLISNSGTVEFDLRIDYLGLDLLIVIVIESSETAIVQHILPGFFFAVQLCHSSDFQSPFSSSLYRLRGMSLLCKFDVHQKYGMISMSACSVTQLDNPNGTQIDAGFL